MRYLLFSCLLFIFSYLKSQVFLPPYYANNYFNNKVSRIDISADKININPWDTSHLTATAFNSNGIKLSGKSFSWRSSDSLTFSITSKGNAISNFLGSSIISATVDGISASINLSSNISSNTFVSKNIMLDSLNSWAETSITVNPINPLAIAASANWSNFYSLDGGRVWLKSTIGPQLTDPNVKYSSNGMLFRQGMSAATSTLRGIIISTSNDQGKSFTTDSWAYKPSAASPGNADQPMMCVDNSATSNYKGNIYAVFSDYPQGSPCIQNWDFH